MQHRVWSFDGFELDESRRELRQGEAIVHLEPLVFDLLLALAEGDGALVPKRTLMERLWPDVVVTEASLKRLVSEARRALGDDGRRQARIRTVHSRGYRLGVPVWRIDPLKDC